MDSGKQTEDIVVKKEDLERCEDILDTLISSSEKHQITAAANTLRGWRKQVEKLKTELANPPKTKIAVYGNTGEGKSSLLNAIFDQPYLLPTSDMGDACTSVVIKIETIQEDQGGTEQEGFQADIVFLTHDEWKAEIDLLKNDLSGDSDECYDEIYKDAREKLTAIYGKVSFDEPDELDKTCERRTDISEKLGTIKTTERYSAALELREEIEDYVTVKEDGQQYWPIVKCVVIRLYNPTVCHQGVVFVDLPGIGDSNPVRVKMAEEEKQSARILLVVTKINRCKASPTVASITGDQMYRQMKMDQQQNLIVCTRTDDVDVDGAKKFMNPAEKEEVSKLDKELKASSPQKQQFSQLLMSEEQQLLSQKLLWKCATVRNDYIKRKLCENTDTGVFCVSSVDYMDGVKGFRGTKAPVFVNKKHTEIPKLQAHLEVQAAEAKKQEMSSIQDHFRSILSDTYSYICNFQFTGKYHMAGNVSDELYKMNCKLKMVAKDIGKEIDALYGEKLFTMIDEGVAEAKKKADATCSSWGRSTSSSKKGLAFNTYRATVVRKGSFESKTLPYVDFNADLVRPLWIKMMIPWEEVFGAQTWNDLINDEAVRPASMIIDEYAVKIQEFLLDKQGAEKLRQNLHQIKEDAVFKLQTLNSIFLHTVVPAQRAANRVIVSTVQDKMLSTYSLCAAEAGPGSYDRMKYIMEAQVNKLKETLFTETGDTLKKKLSEIMMNVCGNIEDVLSRIHEDYRHQLNPLWMETVGQKFMEVLVEAGKHISKLLPNTAPKRKEIKGEMSSSGKRSLPCSSSAPAKKSKTELRSNEKKGDFYKMESEPRGLCYIFSNKTFDGRPKRIGTDQDRDGLKRVFSKLKFKVTVYEDKSAEQMNLLLKVLSMDDHSCYDCVVVIFLTHGREGEIQGKDNKWLSVSTITSSFKADNCKSLANKPKLFFFQSCRGPTNQKAVSVSDQDVVVVEHGEDTDNPGDGTENADGRTASLVAPESHFFFGYATVQDQQAQRNTEYGSWFIQELVKTFEEAAHRDHLDEMMTTVKRRVDSHKSEEQDGSVLTQTAETTSRLLKNLYF